MKGLMVKVGDTYGIVQEVDNNGGLIVEGNITGKKIFFPESIRRQTCTIIHGVNDGSQDHEEWAKLAKTHESLLVQIDQAADELNTIYSQQYKTKQFKGKKTKKFIQDSRQARYIFWLYRRQELLANFKNTFGIDWQDYVTICDQAYPHDKSVNKSFL